MKKTLSKIVDSFWLCLGVLFGVVIFGFLVGGVTILVLRSLFPSLPWESVTPPANNIADWRTLAVIAIGCVAFLCFRLIWLLVSQPLGKLIEKGFVKWDAAVARGGSVVEWVGQFVLSKPAPEEIQAAQRWVANNKEFDKSVVRRDYDHQKFEAVEHALRMQKKALTSYPRVKRAGKIQVYLIAIPVCLFIGYYFLVAMPNERVVENQEEEVTSETAAHQWFENPTLKQWSWNIVLVGSAVGFSLWLISWLSEKRYQKMLGADVRHEESDDEIYVANPTDFESWRQAFIDRHGHDMSVEQEKKLRAKVGEVIDADEQARAASRKLYEKLDEVYRSPNHGDPR